MREIGIRELRQHASRHLRDVEAGMTLQVTDRGRPVARIVPIAREDGLEDLIASGRLIDADDDLLELEIPLEPVEGEPSPTDALAALRADER